MDSAVTVIIMPAATPGRSLKSHSDCDRNGKIAQDSGSEEMTRLGSCIPTVSTPAGLRDLAVQGAGRAERGMNEQPGGLSVA